MSDVIAGSDEHERGPDDRERKLNAIITQYRRAVDAGEVTDQRTFLDRYPEILLSLLSPQD